MPALQPVRERARRIARGSYSYRDKPYACTQCGRTVQHQPNITLDGVFYPQDKVVKCPGCAGKWVRYRWAWR